MHTKNTSSTYRRIFDAVEVAVFHKQARNAEDVAKFVGYELGIRNVNVKEMERLIHEVATQYKPSV